MSGKIFVYDNGIEAKIGAGKNITCSVFFDGKQNDKSNIEI